MHFRTRFALAALAALGALTQPRSPAAAAEPKPVAPTVETTLATADRNIRQFAFDSNADTYFASATNPGKDDHFTLVFDAPVAVKAVAATTGKPDGTDKLAAGNLEGSEDGTTFAPLAAFADGTARAAPAGRKLRAVRVKPGEAKHPLVIREIAVESDPPVAAFKYPVEIAVNVDDAPDLKEWAEKAARVCERQYPMICEELNSDGFRPRTYITMTFKNDYRGVAMAGGGRITGSVRYFKGHPDDVGALVHETVHCVQSYRTRGNPGWLVEGIADYVRFFKYEPGKIGRVNPDRWKYDGSYRQTAVFLNYVSEKYDRDLVRKLNAAMREGKYKEEIWQALTKKPLPELGDEWKATLKRQ